MLENYLPIIVFIFLGIAFGVGLTVVGYLLVQVILAKKKTHSLSVDFQLLMTHACTSIFDTIW